MIILTLAWRNLWRNSKRSWITISAVGTALIFLMAMAGLLAGLATQMLANGTGLILGHLQIHHTDYLPDRSLYDWIGSEEFDLDRFLSELRAREDIREAAPRVNGFGLISTGERTFGAQIVGVDPETETNVTRLLGSLAEGRPSAAGNRELVLGKILARTLHARPGTEVAVVTQAADGSIGNDLYRVVGIFDAGVAYLDRSLVLADWRDIQELLALESWQVHEIALTTGSPNDADKVAERLNRSGLLPPDSQAESWLELVPQLREYLQMAGGAGWFLVSLVGVFAAFGTLNTMMMAVFERTREIGTLSALGMVPVRILMVLLLESILLGIIGLAVGFVGGAALMAYLSRQGLDLTRWMQEISMMGSRMDPILKAEWVWDQFAVSAVGLMVAVILATLIPAVHAARLDPVKALQAPTEG